MTDPKPSCFFGLFSLPTRSEKGSLVPRHGKGWSLCSNASLLHEEGAVKGPSFKVLLGEANGVMQRNS